MSASIVRKALEISDDTPSPFEKSTKNAGKRKLKSIEKKKKSKLSSQELLKKNLKFLKSLEFASKSKKYGKNPTPVATSSSNSLSKKTKKKKRDLEKANTAFTEEDFAQFEKEYFVTD